VSDGAAAVVTKPVRAGSCRRRVESERVELDRVIRPEVFAGGIENHRKFDTLTIEPDRLRLLGELETGGEHGRAGKPVPTLGCDADLERVRGCKILLHLDLSGSRWRHRAGLHRAHTGIRQQHWYRR